MIILWILVILNSICLIFLLRHYIKTVGLTYYFSIQWTNYTKRPVYLILWKGNSISGGRALIHIPLHWDVEQLHLDDKIVQNEKYRKHYQKK